MTSLIMHKDEGVTEVVKEPILNAPPHDTAFHIKHLGSEVGL